MFNIQKLTNQLLFFFLNNSLKIFRLLFINLFVEFLVLLELLKYDQQSNMIRFTLDKNIKYFCYYKIQSEWYKDDLNPRPLIKEIPY